jgi:hypothetical protein
MVRGVLLLALIVLAGCTNIRVEGERRSAIKNAAVVAAIPDDVTMTKIGITTFDNVYDRDRWDWGFEPLVRQSATQVLRAKRPDVTVVPVQYDPAQVLERLKGPPLGPEFTPELLSAALKDVVAGKNIDTVFLFIPGRRSAGSYSQVSFVGMGFETSRTLRELAMIIPFVTIDTLVIDVPTMTVLAKNTRRAEDMSYNLNPIIYRDRPVAPFPAGFTMPLNADQRAFLKPRLHKLLETTVTELMQEGGF